MAYFIHTHLSRSYSMKLFGRFNDIGVTMLIATHDLNLLDKLNGRRIQLTHGQLAESDDEALVV